MARILVIDDETPIRSMLRDVLEQDSHEVKEACNGKEAFSIFRESEFDLIITDLVMPEKSGIDLIMELKKEFPDIKVIAISGGGGITGRFDYLPIAKLIGAKAILNKPFHMNELRETITETLSA